MTRLFALATMGLMATGACGSSSEKGNGNLTVYLLNSLRQNLAAEVAGPHQAATRVNLVTTDQTVDSVNVGPTLTFHASGSVGDVLSIHAVTGATAGPTVTCTVTADTANCGGVVMIVGTTDASCQNWWQEYSGTPPDANCVAQ